MNDDQDLHELVPGDPGSVGEKDVVFDCPSCGKSLVVESGACGQKLNCPECGKPVLVPERHRVVTLAEAPETQKIQAMPQWKQEVLSVESAIREHRHQREEAGNLYRHHASEANRLELRIEKKEPGLGQDAVETHKRHRAEADRHKARMEKLDGKLRELEGRRAQLQSEHKG